MQVECAVGDVVIDFGFKACRAAVCSEPVCEGKSKAWTHATTKGSGLLKMPCFYPGLTGFEALNQNSQVL